MLITLSVSFVAALNGSLTWFGGLLAPGRHKGVGQEAGLALQVRRGFGCGVTVTVARTVAAGMPSRYQAVGICALEVAMVESVTRGGWPASVK